MSEQHEGTPTMVVVLSADQECAGRVRRLYQMSGRSSDESVEVLGTSDPTMLNQMLPILVQNSHIVGLILDLTPPHIDSGRHPPSRNPDETTHAWYVGALVAAGRVIQHLPMIIVSAESYLATALHHTGVAVVAWLDPAADDKAWQSTLRHLLSDKEGQDHQRTYAQNSNLHLDFTACTLYLRGKAIALTTREAILLRELLRAPGHYLSVAELASRITQPGAAYPVDEHGVEQTICGLRRKIGEPSRCSRVLQNRRGMGYAIFPKAVSSVAQLSQPRGGLSERNVNGR